MWIGKQGFAVLDIDWQSSGPALTSSFYDFKGTTGPQPKKLNLKFRPPQGGFFNSFLI